MCSISECKERDDHKLKKCFFFIVGQTDEQTVRKTDRQTDGRDQFFFKMMDSQKNASKLKLRYL